MLDTPETLHWQALIRPHGSAERALGKLAFALESSPLHGTWLWREIARAAVTIAQAQGYKVSSEQLRRALIGLALARTDQTPGLGAAKRIFLEAEPLFRQHQSTDSSEVLWPRFWQDQSAAAGGDDGGEPPRSGSGALIDSDALPGGGDGAGEVAWPRQGDQLLALVRELAGFAHDGRRPALINLLVDLRGHAKARRLPAALVRLALPLAIKEVGLLPKAAPGLLGGRRLPLGMSAGSAEAKPLTPWLVLALEALAKEAEQAQKRLAELTRQHRAWHGALMGEGLRKHARAPAALDLLAATPVLSIGLVARHLGCSHVAAGQIVARLAGLGILIEAASRARHKIYVAGDLPGRDRDEADPDAPLALSAPPPSVDVDGIGATLDGLYADLERLNERARDRTEGGGATTRGD